MNEYFSKEGVKFANRYMKKMFHTFAHWGNANLSHNQRSAHSVRVSVVKKTKYINY
jgi:hypothetical protein